MFVTIKYWEPAVLGPLALCGGEGEEEGEGGTGVGRGWEVEVREKKFSFFSGGFFIELSLSLSAKVVAPVSAPLYLSL